MKDQKEHSSRRDFLKSVSSAGLLSGLNSLPVFGRKKEKAANLSIDQIQYQYRTVDIKYLNRIKNDMEGLKKSGKLSKNKTYRSYLQFQYQPSEKLAAAKSIIIIAVPLDITVVNFWLNNKKHPVIIPPGYVVPRYDMKLLDQLVLEKIIKRSDRKIERASLPLKMLTVRSGLGQYGKNNITFIKGMGSYHMLRAYYTDHEFTANTWKPISMMRVCKGCYICMKGCPTECITEEKFVIDVGKCVTLYNEITEPMPGFFAADVHNALVGCMKCQEPCPANLDYNKNVDLLEDITEPETRMILAKNRDKSLVESVKEKLSRSGLGNDLDYLSRNLNLVLGTRP